MYKFLGKKLAKYNMTNIKGNYSSSFFPSLSPYCPVFIGDPMIHSHINQKHRKQ